MSDTFHLHCETHDERIGSIQRYAGTLAAMWEKRQSVIDFYDNFVCQMSGSDAYPTEVNWEYRGSDHNFEDSFESVAAWFKKHNDCQVYVYMYGHRDSACWHVVTCESCGGQHHCQQLRDHKGAHSYVRPPSVPV